MKQEKGEAIGSGHCPPRSARCRLSTVAGKPCSYFAQWAEGMQYSNFLRIGTKKSLRAKADWFLDSCRHMDAGTARHCPPLPAADRLLIDGRNFDGKLSKSPKSLKNRFAAEKMLDRIRKLWYDYLTSLQRRFCCACILLPCLCASVPPRNVLCPKEGGKLSFAVCPAAQNLRKILHRRCRQCA